MKPQPRIVVKQPRPRQSVPSPDDAIRDAIVIAGMIGFLFVIYLMADMVRQLPS